MTTEKMRCHPSIILEKTGGLLTVWIAILLSQAENAISFFREETIQNEDLLLLLPLLGLLLLIPLLIIGYQFLVWRKTWIYMDGTTFIIERNTMLRKKNAYSIAHISNINIEQNLFELLIHTCRLKLDMENASDADSTDISILLSRQKAQELKAQLLSSSSQGKEDNWAAHIRERNDYASFHEILTHCICSFPGYSLIFFFVLAAFFIFMLSDGDFTLSDLLFEDSGNDFFMKALAVCILIFTYGNQIIKRLLAFYHFSAFRQGDDIIIHYGFFRKQDYTIPVERIHALRIVQPPIARLAKRAEAQIVCVGIGDAKEELTQLSLCRKKEDVFKCLAELLPEFPTASINHMQRPPKHAGILYFCSCLSWTLLCCLLPYLLMVSIEIPNGREDSAFLTCICLFAACCILLYHLLRYFCLGFYAGSSFALFSGGSLTRTATMVPYSHMQHLCLKQNPLSRHFRLFRGEAYILASTANREIAFPYIMESDKNLLAQKIMRG